ncbi:MAG TPA: hypothetical protein VLL76_01155, partial [Candidatus Omnitrophota bacterium]|nr:hypothetical protein [Candidatus Omnitrophota bacterium]
AEFMKAKGDETAANGSTIPDGPQVASASPYLNRQILAEQPAQPAQGQEQKTSTDPRAESLVTMASAPIANPGQSALLKPVDKLTQAEMQDMIASPQGEDLWQATGKLGGKVAEAAAGRSAPPSHAAIFSDQRQKATFGWLLSFPGHQFQSSMSRPIMRSKAAPARVSQASTRREAILLIMAQPSC